MPDPGRATTGVKPSLLELFARLHISLADIDGREPVPEATELVDAGEDCRGRRVRLAPEAAAAWTAMHAAATGDGVVLLVVSAYRSYEHQARLWERKLAAGQTPAEIRRVVNVPGFSQHHTGRALDLGTTDCVDLPERFETTDAFRWLTSRAAAFGFSMPYGRGNALGVIYEPWHWFWNDASPMLPRMHHEIRRHPTHLEVVVTGHWEPREFRPLLESIRVATQESGTRLVLVDARSVPDNPSAADRFEAGKTLAAMLGGVRVALVFDPGRTTRLAENTAVNRGAEFAIFGEPPPALAWLQDASGARTNPVLERDVQAREDLL